MDKNFNFFEKECNQQYEWVHKNTKLFENDDFLRFIQHNPQVMNELHNLLDIKNIKVLYDRNVLKQYLKSCNTTVFNIIMGCSQDFLLLHDGGEHIIQQSQADLVQTLNDEYAQEYTDFNEYLKNHPIGEINLQKWLNKQQYTSKLPEDSLSSWNRYPLYPMLTHTKEIGDGKEMLNKKVNDFFGYVKGNILKNREYTMKLAQEMGLQEGLEKVYFGKLKEGSIVRVDYGYPTLFEFDDFPRGIFYASILEEYENVKQGKEDITPSFVKHIEKLIQPGTKFVFVLHETASYANVQEHTYMAKLLQHYGIDAICISHQEWEDGVANGTDKELLLEGQKIGGVWHHLMNTPEAPAIVNQIVEANIPLLPHFHALSHKGIHTILSDEYDEHKLSRKNYLDLIDENTIPYSKILLPDSSIEFKGGGYSSYKDLFKQGGENFVIKLIGAENAEGVYILQAMTKKEKNALYDYIDQLPPEKKSNVMIQEYNPNKSIAIPVYNSYTKNPELLQGSLLSRVFYVVKNGKLAPLTGIDQITMGSKAHGMVDMASYYSL